MVIKNYNPDIRHRGSMSANPISSAPLIGASYMSFAMLMGAGIDISVKALAADYATAQIVLLRAVMAAPLVLVICHFQGGLKALATPKWGWQLYRGLLTAGANFGFFYGLAHIPLVNAVLLAYLAPVLIVLLARPLLGERVGLHRWLGVLIAFAGVLVVVRPGAELIGIGVILVLGSRVFTAAQKILAKKLSATERTSTIVAYTALGIAVISFFNHTFRREIEPAAGPLGTGVGARAMHFDTSVDDGGLPTRTMLFRAAAFFGWLLGFMGWMALIGVIPTVLVFVVLYMRIEGKEPWRLVAIIAIGMTLFCYMLFEKLLTLPWPATVVGDLFPILPDIVPSM